MSATIWSATEGSQNTITLELEYNSGNPKFDRIENLRLLIAFPTSNEPEVLIIIYYRITNTLI